MASTVFIFEDNQLIRQGLEAILESDNEYLFCGSAPNGNEWEKIMREKKPDVILMDIEMPGDDGIALTGKIKQLYPETKILIQTVFDDSERIFNALCAGASGYILKNDTPTKLLGALSESLNGGAPMSPSIAKKVIEFFAKTPPAPKAEEKNEYHLSDREKEILGLMVKGHNLKAIAEKCFISYETVRTHVKKIYKKLHVATGFEAIHKANDQKLV